MSRMVNIPDLFKAITAKVSAAFETRASDPFAVFFDYGHYNEVTERLISKSKGVESKTKRYPLIWLVMDFTERYSVGYDYYCELPDLQIIIAAPTKANSSTAQRIEDTFKPRLYPIYEELLYQMVNSGFFHDLDESAIPHEKIDRPYWGGGETASASGANLFNDYIDAIQIRKLRLFVNDSVKSFKIFKQ